MPYRLDIPNPPPEALGVLVEFGALDIEMAQNELVAILPDCVTPYMVASTLRVGGLTASPAVSRDDGSVWLISPRAVGVGSLTFGPANALAGLPNAIRMTDAAAFGSGHHATTALCVEALEDVIKVGRVDRMLDVGTGSGILALAALRLGVPQVTGLDIDADALHVARENALLNQVEARLKLVCGTPGDVTGTWPLIVANVLAAPLIGMAPILVQRLASQGELILSGIHWGLEAEVTRAYRHFGMRIVDSRTRDGWTALIGRACW